MTPEARRIAIAEACGAKWGHPVFNHDGKWHVHFAKDPFEFDSSWAGNPPPFEQCEKELDVPDYLNELNAAIQLCDLLAELGWNCALGNGLDKTWECEFYKAATDQTHSDNLGTREGKQIELHYGCADTLPQAISEAFLRTLGLWRDDASDTAELFTK